MEKYTQEQLTLMHPHDLAELFLSLNDDEKNAIVSLISNETLSDMVSYLEPDEAVELLAEFDTDKTIEVVDYMEPDDARDIIAEMDEEDRDDLLEGLKSGHSLTRLLSYDDNEAGAHMTDLFISLTSDLDVKEATKRVIKLADSVESIRQLFVVDESRHFLGSLPLKKLIKSRYPLKVSDIFEAYPSVLDTDKIYEVIYKMNDYDSFEMPVCSQDNVLVGMITLDDALEIYHEESIEDYEKLAALPDTEDESFIKSAAKRLPWLVLLLVLSIPIALVTSTFEEVLATVAVLAFFQPLILDAAGDVATQTLAVTLRILSRNPEKALRNGLKEINTGLITGTIMGAVAALLAYFLALQMNAAQPLRLCIVVGLSLWLTVIVSPVVGFLVPVTLDRIKIDPAVASGPFITTLVDVMSLILFFGLATLILGGV